MRMGLMTRGAAALFLALCAWQTHAMADPGVRYRLNVPAEPVTEALKQFAAQTNLQVIYYSDVAAGATSHGVAGAVTAAQALRQILSGTGLTYLFVNDHTVAIRNEADTTGTTEKTLASPQRLAAAEEPQAPVAQTVGSSGPSRVAEAEKPVLSEVIVTGTHIRGADASASPVTTYNRVDIDRSGATSLPQFMRTLPQNFAQIDANTAIGATANSARSDNSGFGAAIDLHGVGGGATLVLLNGERLAPTGAKGATVDISMIPLSAIERIDVMTDGASAIYGSDAIAGVVNIVLRKDLTGVEVGLEGGGSKDGGGTQKTGSVAGGNNWSSGSALFTFEYYDQQPVLENQRDFITLATAAPDGHIDILPSQKRNSVLLNVRQWLGDQAEIFADVTFSRRDFHYDAETPGANLIQTNDGFAKAYGAVAGLNYHFDNQWIAELVANQQVATLYLGSGTTSAGVYTLTTGSNRSTVSSVDLRGSGALFDVGGRTIRASIGAHYRSEDLSDTGGLAYGGSEFARHVSSVYSELLIPLLAPDETRLLARRLELSGAVRYDHYSEFGSATEPKVGLLWSPLEGLNFRGTYARSFRAPPLGDLSNLPGFIVWPVADPNAPGHTTNAIIDTTGGNVNLKPERSNSLTAGVDFVPTFAPHSKLSLTYFRINYTDRIDLPPVSGSIFSFLSQQAQLAPFITFNPDPAQVARIYAGPGVTNPFNIPAASIGALFEYRLSNIAASLNEGIDLTFTQHLDTALGALDFNFGGSKLLHDQYQAASTTPAVEVGNTAFYPVSLRLRGGVSWSRGPVAVSLLGNYAGSYDNTLFTPAQRIASWTTFDGQLSYQTPSSAALFLRDLKMSLSVQNILDRNPPHLNSPVGFSYWGFDPTNASAMGRFISVGVSKKF